LAPKPIEPYVLVVVIVKAKPVEIALLAMVIVEAVTIGPEPV
jgi:hypothetical protein